VSVAKALRRRGSAIVEQHHFGGNEVSVETIAEEIRAARGEYEPDAVNRLAPFESHDAKR
jgi:hypothetical protein